jgi:DNA-binding CsgD family transcriptional regulator/N-acetylneuraminic acid mutarotase
MSPEVDLSERELEILRLVATGASNKEIALKLVISPNTVKVHLRNVFAKIGAASRTEAALYALRAGLVDHLVQPAVPPEATPAGAPRPAIPPDGGATEMGSTLGSLAPALPVPESAAGRFWRSALPLVALLGIVILLAVIALMRINNNPQAAAITPTSALPLVNAQRWQDEVPLPLARSSMAAQAYESSIYIIGGETPGGVTGSTLRLKVGQNQWQKLLDKPTPVADAQAALVGERIYVPGGRLANGNPTQVLEVYDLRLARWQSLAPLPAALSAYALAAVDGRLYLFGGWDGQQIVDTVYAYDPESNAWQLGTAMSSRRAFAAAVALEGRILLIGGTDGAHPLDTVQVYFPQRDQAGANPWEEHTPLPQPRSAVGAASIAGLVYVFGGESTTSAEGGLLPLQYQPLSDQWVSFDRSPVAIGAHPAMVTLDTRLYVLGGLTPGGMSAFDQSYQAIYTINLPNIRQ